MKISAQKYRLLLVASSAIVAADQIAKLMVQAYLPPNQRITIIEGFFNLVNVTNPGGAFGFLSRAEPSAVLPFFLILTAAAAVLIIYFYPKAPSGRRLYRCALSFILGGAVGNLIDRVRLGVVIDFLDLHLSYYHWPAFNIADLSITVGAIMFLVSFLNGNR